MSKLTHLLLFASVSAVSSIQASSLYVQNFDAFEDGDTVLNDGSTLEGTRLGFALQVEENNSGNNQETALQLTSDLDVTGGRAKYILPELDPGQAITEFDLTFNSLMKSNPGNGPADGFSFNFGDLDLNDSGVFIEDGWASNGGDVLSVSWDTFDSGSGDIFGRVAVFLNGSEVAGKDNTVNNVVESTLDASFQEVAISWSEIDGLSVDYAGTSVYTNAAVALTTEPGYRFAFGARTGGETQTTQMEDISLIVAEPASF